MPPAQRPHFDDQEISFIGGEAVAWPENGPVASNDMWHHMRRAVGALRETVKGSCNRFGAIEDNRDLAEQGRARQLNDVGIDVILRVDDNITVKTARLKAEARVAALDAEMQAHALPPDDPAGIALATEIRSALRGMTAQERLRFIRENLNQPGVAGAVTSAAGYLSGLSPTEQAEVRNMVAETLYGPQAAEKAQIARGLRELEVAVGRAHGLIAKRARLARNLHGEWAPAPVNLPAGATPPGAVSPARAFAQPRQQNYPPENGA